MTESTARKTLDFAKVEALRKHLLLTLGDMAEILDVSRLTYNKWVDGGTIRKSNDEKVRNKLRMLLRIMEKHDWPKAEVVAMSQKQRSKLMLELVEEAALEQATEEPA